MPGYLIQQYEIHAKSYRVEAADEASAIAKLFGGDAEATDEGSELIEVADDLGLPADEYPELARELNKLGFRSVKDVIPSIRSIELD